MNCSLRFLRPHFGRNPPALAPSSAVEKTIVAAKVLHGAALIAIMI
jgi:hypothetical protein